jgi:hypothetical protein
MRNEVAAAEALSTLEEVVVLTRCAFIGTLAIFAVRKNPCAFQTFSDL